MAALSSWHRHSVPVPAWSKNERYECTNAGHRRIARLPARAARGGPGGGRGARGHAGQPVHQDHGQAVGARHGHLDDRPDHAGGPGHAGQGPRAVRQGQAPRPRRPDRADGRRRLRVPGPGPRRRGRAEGQRGARGQRGHRVPQRADQPGGQARRREVRGLGGRRRGGHGHRPRRLPGRGLPAGLRRDRRGQGGLRRRSPQGDPGDRRAGHAGQRAAGVLAGHAGRGRLHQDLDRQGHPGRDAAGDPGHAGGRPRLPG